MPDPPHVDDAPTIPSWCPRCANPDGPFHYDVETDTWVCSHCAATWCASVPERRR